MDSNSPGRCDAKCADSSSLSEVFKWPDGLPQPDFSIPSESPVLLAVIACCVSSWALGLTPLEGALGYK